MSKERSNKLSLNEFINSFDNVIEILKTERFDFQKNPDYYVIAANSFIKGYVSGCYDHIVYERSNDIASITNDSDKLTILKDHIYCKYLKTKK